MDTLTHLALGACLGEAFAGRKLGKPAMLWGALAHTLPDLDVLAYTWQPVSAALLSHRGFTHSFLFCILTTPALAVIASRIHASRPVNWRYLSIFLGSALLLHDGLDALNNYGVGWLEPFSNKRISFNIIYVADPFLTVWPLCACLALLFGRTGRPARKIWCNIALAVSALYLLFCGYHKVLVDHRVTRQLHKQKITYTRYFTTPAPLQNWLWYVTAGTDSGYYTGYMSVLDNNQQIQLQHFPRNSDLLQLVKNQDDVRRLIRFSKQFYMVEIQNDTLVFNDLRFGQVAGWQNPQARFAFRYFLDYPGQNRFVVQRGRFSGWDERAIRSLLDRIASGQAPK